MRAFPSSTLRSNFDFSEKKPRWARRSAHKSPSFFVKKRECRIIIGLVGRLCGKLGGVGLVAVTMSRLLMGWVVVFLKLGWLVCWPVVVAWLNGLLAG